MNNYAQLTIKERNYIEYRLKKGDSYREIARALKRSPSTISREVARNSGLKGYRHKQAQRLTDERHLLKAERARVT